MKKLWLLALLCFIQDSFAFSNPYTMRSPQALLMGDAFTAVNDDEFTLFYNPASLGRHKRDFTLNPFNPQFGGTNVLGDLGRFQNIPDTADGFADVLLDYPVHASAGIAPGFKLFNVGVTFLANESFDVLLRNRAHPMMDLDLRSDRGVMVGIGIPIGPSRINRRNQMGSQTTFGIGAKYIERTGVRDTLALGGTTVLDAISQDDLQKILNSLGQVKGIGYGFDAGFEHVARRGNSQFVMGLSALDITGTKFSEQNHPDKLQVADIKDQINLGMAAGQDLNLFHYIFSMDIRGLNEEMDFSKRLRLGAQVGIPGLKLMAGLNSGYYSYGAMVDMAFMKLTAGFYDMELGSTYKQIKSRRFVIYLSLFDFSFDA